MLETKNEKCHAIIHAAATAAGAAGAGLAQLPLADAIPITAIQVGMVISLGQVYNVDLDESAAKALIGGFATSVIGRNVAGVLVGWVPVIGNIIKAGTASALTEAMGWFVVKHFENVKHEIKASREDGFLSGVKSGEEAVLEKIKPIFEKFKENDCFIMSCLTSSSYLTENTNLTILEEVVISSNILNRLKEELSNINERNVFEYLQKYLVKLNNDDLSQVKKFIEKLEGFELNKEKKEKLFKIIDTIPIFRNLVHSDSPEEMEEKILSMLDNI